MEGRRNGRREGRKEGKSFAFLFFPLTVYIIECWRVLPLTLAALLTTSCGSGTQAIPHENVAYRTDLNLNIQRLLKRYPEWWKRPPPDDKKYKYGVGSSSKSRKKAVEDAQDELIRSLQIFIQAEIYWQDKWQKTCDAEKFAKEMVEYRMERYRSTLPGTDTIVYHQEGNMYYALVQLEKAALERQGTRDKSLVQDAYRDARALKAEGKILRSIEEYINALSYARLLLEGTPFDYMDMDRNGRNDFASQQIERELRQLLSEIQLSPEGNEQVGYFGEGLQSPLVVIARVAGQVVGGLPIQFYYQSGRGKLSDNSGKEMARNIETQTDRFGRASVKVAQIEAISLHNEIVAKMNLLPLLDRLTEREEGERTLLRRIFERRESQKVIFQYTSTFMDSSGKVLTVSLDGKSNHPVFEDGSEVTLKIETPGKGVLHIFHVNASGEIRFKTAIKVEYVQRLKNLTISETPRGFEISISGNKLIKRTDEPESEAIVVIASKKQVAFEQDVSVTKEVIINRFKEAGINWTVGQVSYEIQ